MPFKSKAQRSYLYAKKPDIAAKFAAHGKTSKRLPRHVRKKKK